MSRRLAWVLVALAVLASAAIRLRQGAMAASGTGARARDADRRRRDFLLLLLAVAGLLAASRSPLLSTGLPVTLATIAILQPVYAARGPLRTRAGPGLQRDLRAQSVPRVARDRAIHQGADARGRSRRGRRLGAADLLLRGPPVRDRVYLYGRYVPVDGAPPVCGGDAAGDDPGDRGREPEVPGLRERAALVAPEAAVGHDAARYTPRSDIWLAVYEPRRSGP